MDKIIAILKGISCFWKVCTFFRNIFWKNGKAIYVNSNKGDFDDDFLYDNSFIRNGDFHVVRCYTSTLKYSEKWFKKHFQKQKRKLYIIVSNSKKINEIIYCGYPSTPLAVFDGFILGDMRKYYFADIVRANNRPYLIEYSKNWMAEKIDFDFIHQSEENVSLVIETSGSINNDILPNYPTARFTRDFDDVIRKENIDEVCHFVSSFFECCKNKNVQMIHIYSRTKVPISFAIGLAIKHYSVRARVYECVNNSYPLYIDLSTQKIGKTNE